MPRKYLVFIDVEFYVLKKINVRPCGHNLVLVQINILVFLNNIRALIPIQQESNDNLQ